MTDAAVTGVAVTDGAVAGVAMADGAVTGVVVIDAAVTDGAVADAAMTGVAVASGAATGGAVTGVVVIDAAVTDGAMADGAVMGVAVASGAVAGVDPGVIATDISGGGRTSPHVGVGEPGGVGVSTVVQDHFRAMGSIVEVVVVLDEHDRGEHAPVEHAPVEHAPVEHAPVEHAPVEHAPAANAPAAHAPADVDLIGLARQIIESLEQRWSRFLPDSDITRLNLADGAPVEVHPRTIALLDAMSQAVQVTDGAFDPTMLAAIVATGYASSRVDPRRTTLLPPTARSRTSFADVIIDRAACTVMAPAGACFDPGGIGKGIAADVVVAELLAHGAAGVLVSVGGDVRVAGMAPQAGGWSVAVRDPLDATVETALLRLVDGGVATSGTARRRWTGADGTVCHHLFDPRTGAPVGAARTAQTDPGSGRDADDEPDDDLDVDPDNGAEPDAETDTEPDNGVEPVVDVDDDTRFDDDTDDDVHPGDLVETTVVAGTAAWAEVWSTALFVLGAVDGLERLQRLGLPAKVTFADGRSATNDAWHGFAVPTHTTPTPAPAPTSTSTERSTT